MTRNAVDLLPRNARPQTGGPAFAPGLSSAVIPSVSNSIRSPALAGWIIIILFFGVLGGWSLYAPLHGAVVANAHVKVEGNRKSVQHLDGGIVKELRVKDGDRVAAGSVLIILDDTQARAEHEVLVQQLYLLRATEERLKTELARAPQLTMPADFLAKVDDPGAMAIWRGQANQFELAPPPLKASGTSSAKKSTSSDRRLPEPMPRSRHSAPSTSRFRRKSRTSSRWWKED